MTDDRDGLAQKLHPSRFTEMSPKMAAIVGYILGESWTEPEVAELAVTGDGVVLARTDGDVGMSAWVGSAEDLDRNVSSLLAVAGLTEQERALWRGCYTARVDDYRGVILTERR